MLETVALARERLGPVELLLGVDGDQEAWSEGRIEPGVG
jgi:hypothetical protein